MKKFLIASLLLVIALETSYALEAKILTISGEVKVRRGVEEKWEVATIGLRLKEIDTILTGSEGEVLLELPDGKRFRLESNAILDIADLREISKQELFLILVEDKINKIEKKEEATPLRIGNVSVVHGASRDTASIPSVKIQVETQERVRNGIRALFVQEYYTNTILKIHNIKNEAELSIGCGELYYYLGKSFESIDNPGQAIDAYQMVISSGNGETCSQSEWVIQANAGIKRLQD